MERGEEHIAQIYATAILGVATDRGQSKGLADEATELLELFQTEADLRNLLESPRIPYSEKRKEIQAILGGNISDTLLDGIGVILRRARANVVRSTLSQLIEAAEEAEGRLFVHLRATAPLTDASLGRLKSALQKETGRPVDIEFKEDPAILGGFVARFGDVQVDATLRRALYEARQRLEGADMRLERHWTSNAEG